MNQNAISGYITTKKFLAMGTAHGTLLKLVISAPHGARQNECQQDRTSATGERELEEDLHYRNNKATR